MVYTKIRTLTINFKHVGKNLHRVSTNSVKAQLSKQNNRHELSVYISLYHVT